MRTILLALMIWLVSFWGVSAWALCPADTVDRGECDTMYVEPWPADTVLLGAPPYFVRVPIYVTHDLVDPWDSVAAFIIPLCYTNANPSAYCSCSYFWNKTEVNPYHPSVLANRSVFRHLPSMDDPVIRNRMMDLGSDFSGREWDYRFADLGAEEAGHGDESHFWMTLVPTGSPDQRWWEGSRELLATMTFKLEDSMGICIDTCFWPPLSHLAFVTTSEGGDYAYAYSYTPRSGTGDPESYRTCFNIRRPPWLCGDASGDEIVDIADVVYLLNYVFKGGTPPDPLERGDVNLDEIVDLADVVYLLNYLFKDGPPPCEPE